MEEITKLLKMFSGKPWQMGPMEIDRLTMRQARFLLEEEAKRRAEPQYYHCQCGGGRTIPPEDYGKRVICKCGAVLHDGE